MFEPRGMARSGSAFPNSGATSSPAATTYPTRSPFAFLQGHDRFLPSRPSSQGSAHTSLFAGVVTGVHIHDALLKESFNCILDLNLVCLGTDAEDILVLLLAH